MKKSRQTMFALLLTLSCGGPGNILASEAETGSEANPETVSKELALAEASRQRAAAAGSEWLNTGSLIDEAQHAADNQDWPKALQLARQAKEQGNLAVAQAERESQSWRDRVVR